MQRPIEQIGMLSAKDEKGFTVIEVMLALGLLAIGLLGLSMMQIMGIQSNRLGYAATRANHIAEQHMEMILNADFNAPGLSDSCHNNGDLDTIIDVDHLNTDVNGNPVDLGEYNLMINVADHTPIADVKTVVVIVTWDNHQKVRRLRSVKTITA